MNEIGFTIIIPTRDRCDTLIHTIQTALSQDYENYRVIVSDNFSSDNTKAIISKIIDARLIYINPGMRLSMTEHWEFALSHVSDGWVTILGDDDGLMPGALRRVNEIINETGTKAIRSNGCSFVWPGLTKSIFGNLSFELKKGYRVRYSKKVLNDVLKGNIEYNELPVLYNGGFVSHELIATAKVFTNKFYCSMTPDVYSAMVFALLTDNYVYSDEPLAINGSSIHSGGTAAFEVIKIKRNYDPIAKFDSEGGLAVHKDIPLVDGRMVRSIPAIVYEAYLQAAPFHENKFVKTNHLEQLRIVLAKSGPNFQEINYWALKFVEKHKLNVQIENLKINSFQNLFNLFNKFKKYLNRALNVYVIYGDFDIPLKNVFDATSVAATLKKTKPTPLKLIFWRINTWWSQLRNATRFKD